MDAYIQDTIEKVDIAEEILANAKSPEDAFAKMQDADKILDTMIHKVGIQQLNFQLFT